MKERLSKEKLLAVASATVLALGASACGKNTEDSDKGSAKINECPVGYTNGLEPLTDRRDEFSVRLSAAATDLVGLMPERAVGDEYATTPEHFDYRVGDQGKIALAAATTVYHIKDRLGEPPVFLVDTTETRIDDLSEQYCANGSDIYVTSAAAKAIGAMSAAGVDVSGLTSTREPAK